MKTYANKSFEKDKKDLIHVVYLFKVSLMMLFFTLKTTNVNAGQLSSTNVLDIEDISSQVNVDIYEKRVINIF